MNWLQCPAVVLGLLGAILVAQASPKGLRWGFLCWIVSNICLILWATSLPASVTPWGLIGMYVFYTITSVSGYCNSRRKS